MTLAVVLAVGMDSSLLASQRPVWQSAGYHITAPGSIKEAMVQFWVGDFDLILLGHSIPFENRERLTFLIRASGSRKPLVCVTDLPGDHESFADATIRNEPDHLLQVIGELLANRTKTPAVAHPYDAG